MVEIERTGARLTYTSIVVRRKNGIVELRLRSGKNAKGDSYIHLTPKEARCVAYMLLAEAELAEAEHPTRGGRLVQDNAEVIVKRTGSNLVELRLGAKGGPHAHADMNIPTTRRVAFALMGESEA